MLSIGVSAKQWPGLSRSIVDDMHLLIVVMLFNILWHGINLKGGRHAKKVFLIHTSNG